jgi:hypothetical protein
MATGELVIETRLLKYREPARRVMRSKSARAAVASSWDSMPTREQEERV